MARYLSVWLPIQALLNGILAVVLSFFAYSRRVKGEDVHNFNGVCSYPETNAWYYGLWAALNLLVGQITISYAMRCVCCIGVRRFSSKCPAIASTILFVISWISFVITQIGLISTSVTNNHKFLVKHHSISNEQQSCYVSGENLFLGTAIWCIITTVFGLISYAFWACGIANTNNNNVVSSNNDQGIAMGHPHTQLPKEQC